MRQSFTIVAPIFALIGCEPAAIDPSGPKTENALPAEAEPVATFKAWQGPDTFVMVAPPELDAEQWRIEAKNHCGDREFCTVVGWASETEAASGFPMTDRELEAQVFSYSVNRVTGHDKALWDCSVFPRSTSDECLAK